MKKLFVVFALLGLTSAFAHADCDMGGNWRFAYKWNGAMKAVHGVAVLGQDNTCAINWNGSTTECEWKVADANIEIIVGDKTKPHGFYTGSKAGETDGCISFFSGTMTSSDGKVGGVWQMAR